MIDCSIRILPPDVANKIAAGEVIERPSSVVKELVENSIDAGATKIIISLEDGGKSLIKVIDDGIGMTRDELRLSIERHATSKIRDISDIERIRTLGFRGEALPSILAVSKLRIKSKKRGANEAWQLISDFGNDIKIEPASVYQGTTIEVAELFENLPARKKFLKSTQVEFQHALTLVKIFSVGYHELEFKLYHNNKLSFSSTSCPFSVELVSPIFNDKKESFFTHDEDFGDYKIRLVLSTDNELINQKGLYYFLNKRFINGRLFNKVISDATRIALGREISPVGAIFIECPPDYYDVNVHPSKMEVKFKTSDIYKRLFTALKNALLKNTNNKITSLPSPNQTQREPLKQSSDWKDVLNHLFNRGQEANDKFNTTSALNNYSSQENKSLFDTNITTIENQKTFETQRVLVNDTIEKSHSYVNILGQVNNTFILVETRDGLSIIDQHALHEGILYNDLMEHYLKNEFYPSQLLLFPKVISINNEKLDNFIQYRHDLEKLGLRIDIFGDDELIVRAIPLIKFLNTKDVDFKEFLDKILDSSVNDRIVFIKNAISVISCDLAVKAGTTLKYEEMKWLVENMYEKGIKNCPHGRPIMYTITFKEINNHLGRR